MKSSSYSDNGSLMLLAWSFSLDCAVLLLLCFGSRCLSSLESTFHSIHPGMIRLMHYCFLGDEGMIPRSSIFAYLVPAKEEARSKDTRSPQGPALRLGVEGKKYL
jgi:hypothetical protein